jgi:hypothetical protein
MVISPFTTVSRSTGTGWNARIAGTHKLSLVQARSPNEAGSSFGLGLAGVCFGWPFWKEAVSIVRLLPRVIVGVPYVRKMENRAGLSHGSKSLHRVAYDLALQFRLMWSAGLMAKRKIQEHCTRWIDCLGYIKRRGHAKGGNSSCFNHSRNQSNGLMAHGSSRDQVECINLSPLEFLDNFRGEFVTHLAHRIDSTHETIGRI